MRVLQVNPVIRRTTSTGRIMQEIGEVIVTNGGESYLAFGGGRDTGGISGRYHGGKCLIDNCRSQFLPVGGYFSTLAHLASTRLFDRHGRSSSYATRRFVTAVERISPDIVHLHNLHGYYLDYTVLFDYLKRSSIPVVWTFHDCWAYTGHCYYYTAVGCQLWKTGCHNCPQLGEFPKSMFFDRSKKNYLDKSRCFNSLDPGQLTIVCVSEWMKSQLSGSFLKDIDCMVIHNGIDTSVFGEKDPRLGVSVMENFRIPRGKRVLMAVANIWSKYKGLGDLLGISGLLRDDEILLIVGKLPKEVKGRGIITTGEVSCLDDLALLYSLSDVVINPTFQDNFPNVILEAQACGTPVVTYDSGGCGESLTEETGVIVGRGDYKGLLRAARNMYALDKETVSARCRENIALNFNAGLQYQKYVSLYKSKIKI